MSRQEHERKEDSFESILKRHLVFKSKKDKTQIFEQYHSSLIDK